MIRSALALLLLLGGCASRPSAPPTVAEVPAARAEPVLPDRIVIPASYRLVLLDGQPTLVREPDAGSPRVLSGSPGSPGTAYQPALVPQELAAEVAANRESAERLDNALVQVMGRSRELGAQAEELKGLAARLSEQLAATAVPPKAPAPAADPPKN